MFDEGEEEIGYIGNVLPSSSVLGIVGEDRVVIGDWGVEAILGDGSVEGPVGYG